MSQESSNKAHFDQLYLDIVQSLAGTSEQLEALKVDHEEGRKTLGGIRERLAVIRATFDAELAQLQEQAEWDRFTLAFFGETNAGKSTVLEALRILFSEEGRQAVLEANDRDLVRYEQALQAQVESVRTALAGAMTAHGERLLSLQAEIARLEGIIRAESSTRVRRRQWLYAAGGGVAGAVSTLLIFQALRAS